MEEAVVKVLKTKGYTVSIAESCTGGLAAANITNVPGASEVFSLSMVTYSDDSKIKLLKVPGETIKDQGPVSKETAIAMAEGIRKIAETTLGLSITGIAGPGGGTAETPVGLVHFALAGNGNVMHEEKNFLGDRNRIRQFAAKHGLNLIRKAVNNQ
jgi:PncC family amidohydrolase